MTDAKRPAGRENKKWTVMIYFAGDNNLSEEMIFAIKEMYRVGVAPHVDVIVQFDPSAIGAPVRRYVISQEELVNDVRIPQIAAAVAVGKRKAMVASAVHSRALPSEVSKEFARAHETAEQQSERRKTDFIAGLDVDSNIIELLGIPLVNQPRADRKSRMRAPGKLFEAVEAEPTPLRRDFENSSDPEVLEAFIKESMENFPSDHYMVVLSGHGNGALGDFLPDNNTITNEVGKLESVSIPSLKRVFENLPKKINILGMDSCLMSMAEIGYELKDEVSYLVGSESYVLNIGWPYHRVLEAINLTPEITPPALAEEIVKKYIAYYEDYESAGASTDQSVCNLLKFGELTSPVALLASALQGALKHPVLKGEIILAHWEAQSYKAEQYTDLYDFCDRLQRRCLTLEGVLQPADGQEDKIEQISRLTQNVLEAFQREKEKDPKLEGTPREVAIKLIQTSEETKKAIKSVAELSCYTGAAFQHSHGLSVYFPWSKSEDLDKYMSLPFALETYWGAFLEEYVKETLRKERPGPGTADPGHFNRNPNNEIVEAFLLVRQGTSGNPRGMAAIGSMKNPPTKWHRNKCPQEH